MKKESESKSQDSNESLGLHTKQPFDSSAGMAKGNEDGNQRPAGNPTGPKPVKPC